MRKEAQIMLSKKLTAVCLCACLLIPLCGCNTKNIDKFYGTNESSQSSQSSQSSKTSSDTSGSAEESRDITKDYSLDVPVWPQYFTLGEYKNLTYYVNDDSYKVTDNMIQNQMATDLDLEMKNITDKKAERGDIIVVDFEGKINGKAFDGNSAKNYETTLGQGKLSESFEENIIGMKPGETKKIKHTFPEKYNDTSIAGKTADFEIKLVSIKNYDLKDITDKLVSEKTKYKNVDEYKKSVKESLEKDMQSRKETEISAIVLDKIIANATITGYDDSYYQMLLESAKDSTKSYAEKEGKTKEQYVKDHYGYESYEAYEKSLEPTAKDYMNSMMAIGALADKEQLGVTDEEYQAQIKKYKDNGITDEQLNQYYSSEDIIFSILLIKTQKWIVENSIKLDAPEESSETAKTESSATSE